MNLKEINENELLEIDGGGAVDHFFYNYGRFWGGVYKKEYKVIKWKFNTFKNVMNSIYNF